MSQTDFPLETLPTAEQEASARYRFLVLYAEPFRVLDEHGKGHGAFVALSLGLFLCERYFRYKSGSIDLWREEGFLKEAAKHYGMDGDFFREFWGIYRHGMLYQGTPNATGAYGWDMSEAYPPMPTKAEEAGNAIICLDPWGFTAELIVLCWNDPLALAKICDSSLGGVSTMAPEWE